MEESAIARVRTSVRRSLINNAYVRMIRDIQCWYASKEGNDGSSLYTAILLVSVLLAINIIAVSWLSDIVVHGKPQIAHWSHTIVLWLLALVVGFHFALSRLAGLHERVDVESTNGFPLSAKFYIALTVVTVGASFAAIAYTRG
jgi:hypothetical protein